MGDVLKVAARRHRPGDKQRQQHGRTVANLRHADGSAQQQRSHRPRCMAKGGQRQRRDDALGIHMHRALRATIGILAPALSLAAMAPPQSWAYQRITSDALYAPYMDIFTTGDTRGDGRNAPPCASGCWTVWLWAAATAQRLKYGMAAAVDLTDSDSSWLITSNRAASRATILTCHLLTATWP